MVLPYLKYLWKAKNQHSLHSPFVFDFYNQVVLTKTHLAPDTAIDTFYKQLSKNPETIKVNDMGAGSKFSNNSEKKISLIAKTALKNKKWAYLIAAIAKHYKYNYIIELGTSLGYTSAVIAGLNQNARVYTFEGCGATLAVAKKSFHTLGLKCITPLLGNIDDTLRGTLEQLPNVDMVFFDANHTYEATKRYFRYCLRKAHENSCFIFDDIYWSEGMTKAWEEIIAHQEVTISIDLFQLGIIFFRKKQPKQHFVLKA